MPIRVGCCISSTPIDRLAVKHLVMKHLLHLRTWVLFCLCAMSWTHTNAQSSASPLRPGWYTLGINGGLSYQNSDVPVWLRGGGIGITLAKNLIHSPSGGFDFDLRGRLMYSHSYGLGRTPNFDLSSNPAVNGSQFFDYTRYDQGFIYDNHKTQMGELGLEGVLTFGRLRERTGIVLSAFGGIGLDWYRTTTDQGSGSSDYFSQYQAIDPNRSGAVIRRTLRNDILDHNFESLATGFENNEYGRLRFMPNLGVELGYDLTKRIGIGLGHKVTYARTDILDGKIVPESGNDLHHYTYAQLWYRFNADKQEEPPVIQIIDPPYSPFATKQTYWLLKAEVLHIKQSRQLTVTHNGMPVNFNFRNKDLKVDLLLKDGINTIVITAENSAGKAQAEQIIILEEPDYGLPPTIRYIRPEAPGMVVNQSRYDLSAEIKTIEDNKDIRVIYNGRVLTGWRYDRNNQLLTASLTLVEGNNTIEIEAKNRRGVTAESTNILYEIPILPPTIRLVEPGQNPHRTLAASQTVRLNIDQIRISRGDLISMYYNGFPSNRFEYEERTGRWTANLPLEIGQNFLTVAVANQVGETRLDLAIIREVPPPPLPRPTIQITRQAVGNFNTISKECSTDIVAQLYHVASKSDITVRWAGSNITNFNYNSTTGVLTIQRNIASGSTSVIITASNPSGTTSETLTLSCVGASVTQGKPAVTIQSPANGAAISTPAISFEATTVSVTDKANITIRWNGNILRNFNWDPQTGRVTANLTANSGSNTVDINVQNTQGNASAKSTVTYRIPTPPTVKINTPVNNSNSSLQAVELNATVSNISSINQIQITVNGKTVSSGTLKGNTVSASIPLDLGNNVIRVVATNNDGTDQAETRVNFNIPKPVINGQVPSKDTIVRSNRLDLKTEILHVSGNESITLTVNGQNRANFTFDKSKNLLGHRLVLNNGRNTIEVKATNAAGTTTKTFNITVDTRKPTPPQIKIVSASQPAFDPFNPDAGKSNLIADTQYVLSKEDITFTVNGAELKDFQFDAKQGRITHSIPLQRGTNTIVIRVRNSDGEASDSSTVIY
jgi:hypothetical protein